MYRIWCYFQQSYKVEKFQWKILFYYLQRSNILIFAKIQIYFLNFDQIKSHFIITFSTVQVRTRYSSNILDLKLFSSTHVRLDNALAEVQFGSPRRATPVWFHRASNRAPSSSSFIFSPGCVHTGR